MPILAIPEDRQEWLKLRRSYVGGSEIAALFHAQADYQMSPFALWHVKAGLISEPDIGDNERVKWGNRLEAVIAEIAAEQEGWTLKPGVFAVDDHCEGMSASLDRVILPSKKDVEDGFIGPGALEIKNVDGIQFKRKWLEEEPPAHIVIQHQHQLACAGYAWGAVGAFVGGNRMSIKRHLTQCRQGHTRSSGQAG
jgi:putative phage-type endonuclease